MKNSINNADQNNQNQISPHQQYFARKRIAEVLEETNNSKIIAIPSPTSKSKNDEWLKLGDNSAYFYKYFVAPRLHKKPPTIRPDTDLNHRFKYGVVSIHWQEAFIKNLASLDYKCHQESGLLIFDLKHQYTPSEIKKLYALEKQSKTKINQILKPKSPIPELYHQLLILSKIIPTKIRKMDEIYRRDFGFELNRALARLFKLYLCVANGHLEKSIARPKMLETIDDICATLMILNENNLLDYSTQSRLGTLMVDLKNSVERNLK